MAVQFQDFSYQVKAKLTQAAINGLTEAGFEVSAHANRNVKLDGAAGQRLRGSYKHVVNSGAGEVQIGTGLEEGYWEEFGTGSYAVHGDGRKDWWVHYPDSNMDNPYHYTEAQAKAIAAANPALTATNGRPPAYTLENAFNQTKPAVIAEFERLVREGLA